MATKQSKACTSFGRQAFFVGVILVQSCTEDTTAHTEDACLVAELADDDASAQRVKQLKANAKRAQKTAKIARQQAAMKKAQEKLAKVSGAMRAGVEK